MTNGLVFSNVMWVTGTVTQSGEPCTENFTSPAIFLPANKPDVTLPVIVAVVIEEPVPVVKVSEYFDTLWFFHFVVAVPVSFCPPDARPPQDALASFRVAVIVPDPPVDFDGVQPVSEPLAVTLWLLGVPVSPGLIVADPLTRPQRGGTTASAGEATIPVVASANALTKSARTKRPVMAVSFAPWVLHPTLGRAEARPG
jgi:hypothetical protein